ncbi:MAG: hypothetical protein ABIV21_05310 [Pyrinomonadaceae bacterium]
MGTNARNIEKDLLDEYGFEIFEQNPFPLAYLITFRTYGTWLHGDKRISTRRRRTNPRESKFIQPNVPLKEVMASELTHVPVILNSQQRTCVEEAVKSLCTKREYVLDAVNCRSNHAHAVIGAQSPPRRIADALKASATRDLRDRGLVGADDRIWARGRSVRYLWKPRHVAAAVDYVLYCQQDIPFEFKDE